MDLEEYRKDLLEDVRVSAESEINNMSSEFVNHVVEILINAEEFEDFTEGYFEGIGERNRKMVMDGYYFDPYDKSCVVLISDFSNLDETTNLTTTEINKLYDCMRNLVEASVNGYITSKGFEESSSGYGFAKELLNNINEIVKFRFYIITDRKLSERVKNIKKEDIANKPVELNVWDIKRMYDIYSSSLGKESIEIDFSEMKKGGIPCVNAINNDEYSAYLAVIPGDVLAKMYIDYGARLLEGNVRSFLSIKGKVNKGIRNTILNEEEMFFSYNNGIAATATEIKTELGDDGLKIVQIKDLQIINGGQTTASIANAVLQDKKDVSNIFVPMKLSVVDHEKATEMIPTISRCANSQNKVDEADFFSNHPYHIRMEEYSRKVYAPAVNGNQYQTIWFYERARGQYTQEQMKLTASERKKYQLKNPKNQVIKKVDLAKYINTYEGFPQIVSKGAQYSMRFFAEKIDNQWEKSNERFNEVYYRNVISLAILFKETEKLVTNQDWYKEKRAYRANIVTYSISILSNIIKTQYKNKRLNLKLIWNKQSLYNELEQQLLITTREVYDFITRDDRTTDNVTEWCKKDTCWERAQKEKWIISEKFINSLIDFEEEKEELENGKKERKMINDLNLEMEVVKLGADYWKEVLSWGLERKLINPIEQSFLEVAANFDKTYKTPSNKQAKRIFEIREKLYEEGLKK